MARVSSALLTQLVEDACSSGAFTAGGVDWNHPQTRDRYRLHVERYKKWIAAGHAGPMQYLVRGTERRENPELVFPGLQSAFVALFEYPAHSRLPNSWERGPEYARYIGDDYHTLLKTKLTHTLERSRLNHPDLQYKVCVDTSAVLERAWGELAGLGWIGKNTLLIHPTRGSYFFIGVVFLNLPLGTGPQILPNYCGHCSRCLSACPTQALDSDVGLLTARCISALTLETRGPRHDTLGTDTEQKRAWIAGCDRCQEVCPFNQKRSKLAESSDLAVGVLRTWEEHFAETEADYGLRVRGTALSRVKYADAKRNLRIVFEQLPDEVREPIRARIQSP